MDHQLKFDIGNSILDILEAHRLPPAACMEILYDLAATLNISVLEVQGLPIDAERILQAGKAAALQVMGTMHATTQ